MTIPTKDQGKTHFPLANSKSAFLTFNKTNGEINNSAIPYLFPIFCLFLLPIFLSKLYTKGGTTLKTKKWPTFFHLSLLLLNVWGRINLTFRLPCKSDTFCPALWSVTSQLNFPCFNSLCKKAAWTTQLGITDICFTHLCEAPRKTLKTRICNYYRLLLPRWKNAVRRWGRNEFLILCSCKRHYLGCSVALLQSFIPATKHILHYSCSQP